MSLLPPRKPKAGAQTGIEPAIETALATALAINTQECFIRMPVVEHLTSYKKSTVYQMIREGRFPDRIKLSRSASVWKLSEVNAWLRGEFTPAEPAKTAPVLQLVRNTKGGKS